MFTPAPLFPGARVALLCTSSAVPDGRLAPAVAAVRSAVSSSRFPREREI